MRKEKVSFVTSGGWNHKTYDEAKKEISNFYFTQKFVLFKF